MKDKLHFLSPLFLKYQNEFEQNPRSKVFAPLAEAYRKVGMHDRAIEVLVEGLRHHPEYLMGHLGLAFCYYDMKQFNLAYATLKPFVEINRDNIRLQKLFSEIALAMDYKEEALNTLKYLLFINPKDKDVAQQVIALEDEIAQKSIVHHRPLFIPSNNIEDEFVQFDLSKLGEKSTDVDSWQKKDLLLNEQDNPDEQWTVKKILTIEPVLQNSEIELAPEANLQTTPVVTHTLVDLYIAQGHIEKAVELLEKILLLNPNDQRTKEKLVEIKAVNEDYRPNDDFETEKPTIQLEVETETEEGGRNFLMSLIDEKVLSQVNEDPKAFEQNSKIELHLDQMVEDKKIANSQLASKYQLFLSKIKERALAYHD